MRTTRIDVEGRPGRYATITRRQGADTIEVTILTPEHPDGRVHQVQADDPDDICSMAECLQEVLDGIRGCSGDIAEYHTILQYFAD